MFQFFAETHRGQIRHNNEDAVVVDEPARLVVLADGMGGYNAGEVASHMITSMLRAELGGWLRAAGKTCTDAELRRALDVYVDEANRAIFNASNTNAQYAGMGTTLVVAVFREDKLILGHVGDSRCYRWREGRLTQLTRDHSLLQEQIDAGLLTPEQAALSGHKNLVTRAVGVEDIVLLETHIHTVQPQDWYLLCSDGLSDMLPDEDIGLLLEGHQDIALAGKSLIEAANEAGGRDNIAVILVATPASGTSARSWWRFGP